MINQRIVDILVGTIFLMVVAINPQITKASGCLSMTCSASATLLDPIDPNTSRQFMLADRSGQQSSLLIRQNTPMKLAGGRVVQAASPTFGLNLTRQLWNQELNISSRRAEDFTRQGIGFSGDHYSLQYSSGFAGSHYAASRGLFAGVAPNLFHSNIEQSYRYQSFGVAFPTPVNFDLLAAAATISSENAETRSARAFGFAGDQLSVLMLQGRQNQQTRLNGMALDTRMGDWRFGYQNLQSANAVRYQRFSTVFSGSRYGDFGLAVDRVQNPLFTAATEQRVLLTFSRSFGAVQPNLAYKSRRSGRSRRNHNLAILAIAVVPVAALAASGGGGGSSSVDNSQRFSTQDQVAFNTVNSINPTSVAENREYGGMVYRNSDGSFAATGPIRGQLANVDPGGPSSVPGGTVATASWHTHGGNDPRYLNEEFSSADFSYSEFFGIDGYLGTPLGKFLLYDVNSNVTTQIGTVATQ